ncbi:membrane protein, putative [Microscilla marina ATCC 23134]|uniref:Membrane protein, putative n=1 Tax=Microscilla marina ATCC 23134 TaxID=313606 RepID=A1ZYC2_MICM2|nr:membrane protein, putative [Microscilla marina ATCC 23134]
MNALSKTWNSPKATQNATFWWSTLTICVFSRIFTAIYYIEDVDSLRFALAIKDYNLATYQPHFPAYPVYCFIVKIFYAITGGKLAFSFTVTGGLSLFGVIYFITKIYQLLFPAMKQASKIWIVLLVLLNPFLWLMSNRYMPDLMGLTFLLACVYLFMKAWLAFEAPLPGQNEHDHTPTDKNTPNTDESLGEVVNRIKSYSHEERKLRYAAYKPYYLWAFYLVMGLLIGVRLSYLPLLLVPAILLVLNFFRRLPQLLFFGGLGVAVWFIPLLIDTGGWEALLQIAQKHLDGHFNEWGGTVKTESGYWVRVVRIFQYTWADGLGAYWLDRHWLGIPFSLLIYLGFRNYKKLWAKSTDFPKDQKMPSEIRERIVLRSIINLSIFAYLLWIFFFQNVLYKARHIMPFIPFIVARIAIGIGQNRDLSAGMAVLMLPLYMFITFTLVGQHRKPTAIAQVKNYMVSQDKPQNILYAPELVAFYLKRQHDWKLKFVYADKPNSVQLIKQAKVQLKGGKVYSLIDLNKDLHQPVKGKAFYHNPYVNRMWSELKVYEYK